jgi:hypothetical protein
VIPDWDDLTLTPNPAGWDRLAAAVEKSRRESGWQRFTGWFAALRWSRQPGTMPGYRETPPELASAALDGAATPRDLDGRGLAAWWRATHPYEDPGAGSTGCARLLSADEAVFPLQVCTLPASHPRHQTPAVVLGGGEQR